MRDRKVLLVVALLLAFAAPAHALELVRYDEACRSTGRVSLRQTLVIVDEALVASGPDAAVPNQRWTRALLEVADGLPGGQRGTMNPGEQIKIFLARQEGTELSPVFVGCSPNLSVEQRNKLEEGGSALNDFFTGGAAKRIENARKAYENALVRSFTAISFAKQELVKQTAGKPPMPGSLLRAMASSPRLIDLSEGIPRIVVFSGFQLADKADWPNQKAAREAGMELATNANVDFQRAEVHVIGFPANGSPHLKAFAEAFLLRARGLLVGWRSDGVPQLLPAPTDIRVFGGTVQMGDVLAPVQVRLAVDAQGNLVNSWIEVTTGRSLATPISGKAICKTADACEVKGDGRLMGQAWNPDPGERPVFNQQFAWSGLRYFEMSFNGNSGAVRIWDPSAKIQMGDRQMDDFKFAVQRTEHQQF
ncbi:hypothetical protein [Tardiphaga sp.]|jgi:hypothetical protein|uniref:hypothetical protein n=1 Tax=Tardiphaga sp. TaxID=1926292 RepID=UPI0037DA1C54